MARYNITKTPKEVDKLSPDYYWFKLRTYFAMNGIRREEIAAVLGVTPATVSNYNKDASKVTIESFCKLLRAYHINGMATLENL